MLQHPDVDEATYAATQRVLRNVQAALQRHARDREATDRSKALVLRDVQRELHHAINELGAPALTTVAAPRQDSLSD